MTKLDDVFARARAEKRAALMPYLCAGYPDLEASLDAIAAAARGGADLVEIGVPFSDPIADGPTIQAASTAALAKGATLRKILDALERRPPPVPAVLMTYLNPIARYGEAAFAERIARLGLAGVIVPDLPFDEGASLDAALAAQGIPRIQLVAPTTDADRLARIGEAARGFLYLVSTTGTTGARAQLDTDLGALVERARARTRAPLAVGFGVSTPEQAHAVAQKADGVIVGSALVDRIARACEGEARTALPDDAPGPSGPRVRGARSAHPLLDTEGNPGIANAVESFVAELRVALEKELS